MKKLSANVCAVTHTGRVRKNNEDNYCLNGKITTEGGLVKGKAYIQKMAEPFNLAVCDGMGGEMYGEIASGIAVEAIARHAQNIFDSGEDFSFAISNCLDDANSRICSEITSRGVRLGTTLASIYAVKGRVICASIGDTRIYHFSHGILEQASFDHTHAQGLVDARELAESDAGALPGAKRLTKHLGVFPEEATLSPNVSVIDDVDNGDVLLLCSDGLTDMLGDDEISAIISGGETPQDVSAKLVRKALEKGGKDNITVITAFMTAEETSVFAPIAEAMVGDKDPDYEEEYRSSYGANTADESVTDPYANADADAAKKEIDKKKIILIIGIVAAALLVLSLAAVIIKAAVNRNKENATTVPSTTTTILTTSAPIVTWGDTTTLPTIEDTSEDDSSTSDVTARTDPTHTVRPSNPYGTTRTTTRPTSSRTTTTTKASTTQTTTSTTSSTTASTTSNDSTTGDTTSNTESTSSQESTSATTEPEVTTTEPHGEVTPGQN